MKTVSAGAEHRSTPDYFPPRLLTAFEVADYLGTTRKHVYTLMKQGLPSYRLGRARRFRLADVDAWIDAQAEAVAS